MQNISVSILSEVEKVNLPSISQGSSESYRELRWLSREYRNLVLWKMHGHGHDVPEGPSSNADMGAEIQDPAGMDIDGLEPTEGIPAGAEDNVRGKLALFCPACPQPRINLPEDWMDDPQRYIFVDNIHIHLLRIAGSCTLGLWPWMETSRPIT